MKSCLFVICLGALRLLMVVGSQSQGNHTIATRSNPSFGQAKKPNVQLTDRCGEKVDPGPCNYYTTQWYWDAQGQKCTTFHYGGCMGNRNRFASRQQCVKQCVYKMNNPVTIPDLCLLRKDQGFCGDDREGLWWWHFNSDLGECEKFYYYGCGGNDNRFYSVYYCKKVCGEKLNPRAACDRCDSRTSRCVSHAKYNYTCECRRGFDKNPHGDCTDIDECRTSAAECSANAWCVNTVGSHRCECMTGYRGDGNKCTYTGMGSPTLDCNKCSPHATCASGVCQCKIGFKGDGFTCDDLNECLQSPTPCHQLATCDNTPGSFICKCREGYAGNGFQCTDQSRSCLDAWHRGYEAECAPGEWVERFRYDSATKRCAMFWYSGCNGTSRNHFPSANTCNELCEKSQVQERARICWDKFDPYMKQQCSAGVGWKQMYYFDQATLQCQMFWNDGCQGDTRNVFDDRLDCQWLCEVTPMYKSKSCIEPFDEHYKDQCGGGRWRQFYYYDRALRICRAFWFDGCVSQSQNIFTNYATCHSVCEQHEFLDETRPWQGRRKIVNGTDSRDASCEPNPCMNDGLCTPLGDGLSYTCECQRMFTGLRCTEPPENPCDSSPCANGGTCVEEPIEEGSTHKKFSCECPANTFGSYCHPDPCLSSPCVNNGTCRNMRGFSTFFCDCPIGFSGNRCQFDKHTGVVSMWPGMSALEQREREEDKEKKEKPKVKPGGMPKRRGGASRGGRPKTKKGRGRTRTKKPQALTKGKSGGRRGKPSKEDEKKLTLSVPDDEYFKHVQRLSSGKQEWNDILRAKLEGRTPRTDVEMGRGTEVVNVVTYSAPTTHVTVMKLKPRVDVDTTEGWKRGGGFLIDESFPEPQQGQPRHDGGSTSNGHRVFVSCPTLLLIAIFF